MNNVGIYIHIPFGLRKCPYCNFYSVAEAQVGAAGTLSAHVGGLAECRNNHIGLLSDGQSLSFHLSIIATLDGFAELTGLLQLRITCDVAALSI